MSTGYPSAQPPEWPNPYSETPKTSKGTTQWPWIIIAIAGVSIVGFALCCGGGVWVTSFAMNIITAEVEDQLRDNPRLKENVGEIQEFKMDWTRSFAHDDDETFIYRVKGDKASGTVTVKQITNDDGEEEIVTASLRLDSGTTVELVP